MNFKALGENHFNRKVNRLIHFVNLFYMKYESVENQRSLLIILLQYYIIRNGNILNFYLIIPLLLPKQREAD